MRKAAPDYQKIELLTRELETAHDDLAVKQLRVKDATEQVKDTYVLFALNIANVGFSAVQTGVSMVKMAEGTKVAAWAVKNLNFGMGKWALIATAIIVAYEGIVTVLSKSNKEMYEQWSIIGNINKLMREWGTSTDITLDNYNTKLEYGNTQTQEFSKSWESMTNTVKTEVNKQKSVADQWAAYWSKKTKEVIAEQRIIMGKAMNEASEGGTQGNFNQAQQGESGKSDFQKQLDEIWDFLISPPLSGQVAYAEPYIKKNVIIHNKNASNVLAVNAYNNLDKWKAESVKFGQQLRGYSGPDTSSGTAINIDTSPQGIFSTLLTGVQEPSGPITVPPDNFTTMVAQEMMLNKLNPERSLGVPSSSTKLTTLEDYKERYDIIKKASHELNQNIGLYQSDPNMGTWVILSGELIKQELYLEEEIARLEADILGKPMPKKTPKNQSETIEQLKKKHLEKYPSLSTIISSDKIFRGNMRNITNDAIISHFSKFQNRYSVLPTEYGKLISKGSLMLASGSSLREDAGRYGQFRFNFLRGSGAVFFGGHAGEFIANYQLNTNVGFGSDSRAMQTFEYAQLLGMGVAGLNPQRRRLQSDRMKHRVAQGFRPPATSLRGLVETGAINILLDNQTLNDPSGLGPDPYGNFANGRFASGGAFGTKINRVRVPRWVAEERAKFREYMNSPEGVAEIINRRRNQFASDFYFERYAGGESPIDKRQSRAISGYFGPGEADKALFKAIVGVNEIPNLPVGVQSLMKIRRSFTEPVRHTSSQHAFSTFMKRMGERHRSQNAFLRNAVNRFAGGNYGEFEATTLYGISSYTKNILSSELEAEQVIFQERYGTPLNMEFGTFANVLSDVKRGVSEMNDRLRWNERLDSISTGATVL
jgi:hypothetical protein